MTLTAGPKHAATFSMISHLYCELRGVWSGSGALPRSMSWLAGVLSTLLNPRGLTLAPVPVKGRSTSPYRRPLHIKRKSGFGALCGGRGRERVAFHASAAECTSLFKPDISTAQAAILSSSNSALLQPFDHTKEVTPKKSCQRVHTSVFTWI
jgi:hypothetical protein